MIPCKASALSDLKLKCKLALDLHTSTLTDTGYAKMRARLAVFWAYFTSCSAYSTWCGKYYELAAPHTPPAPDSYFVFPKSSSTPLLDFRCTPASSIYISGDLHDLPEIIMDASLTYDVGLPGGS